MTIPKKRLISGTALLYRETGLVDFPIRAPEGDLGPGQGASMAQTCFPRLWDLRFLGNKGRKAAYPENRACAASRHPGSRC